MMWIFNNADSAFDYYKSQILNKGIDFDNTKALFNVGFPVTIGRCLYDYP